VRNHLKTLRAEHDWTQADLAARVNVSRQTINAIEKEKFDPSLPIAFRIAKVFGMTIEEVFVDEESE
jgi:putative transcriptional regulator